MFNSLTKKQSSEADFWYSELYNYIKWYKGFIGQLYLTPKPTLKQQIEAKTLLDSAIFTWTEMHQKPKYLSDLQLGREVFKGLSVLDVGAGPIPSALCFDDCDLYCLDPLYETYKSLGFPISYYQNINFIEAQAESIPIVDNFFDAIISVNAIDHVDDIVKVADELRRVAKPDVLFAMHVHYHSSTINEPIELNDELFLDLFGWVPNLSLVSKTCQNFSGRINSTEQFALWRNF